jgi:hypothetical protein
MINDLLRTYLISFLTHISSYFDLFFTKIFQNRFIILILITILFSALSDNSSAQNQSADGVSVNNQTNEAQNTQVNQPTLADRIESDLPKDIKIDGNDKNPVIDNSKNKSPYLSQLSSLMFSEEEQNSINIAIESFKNGTAFLPQGSENKEQEDETLINKKSYLYLASIMYVNNRYWAVWINDQKITSDNNLRTNEIYVKNIQKDKVSIIWTIGLSKWKVLMGSKAEERLSEVNAENQIVKKIQLKPNQTYLLLNETIIEGNSPNIPILSKKAENNLQTNNPDNILNQQIQNNNLQQPDFLQPTNISN